MSESVGGLFPGVAVWWPVGMLVGLLVLSGVAGCQMARRSSPGGAGPLATGGGVAQGHAVLTVAESKRLIAKAVVRMPVVQSALQNGMVIVCKGTTNTYVAEELLGRKIDPGAFVIGHVTPAKGGKSMPKAASMPEVVLIKGELQPDLKLDDALKRLGPGDVVMKGGNALDYSRGTVGVWTGSATGGTAGKIMPMIAERRAHLVIPIGLEKQVTGKVTAIAERTIEAVDKVTDLPRMRVLAGHIVTEIEALKILADVEAFEAGSGGIGGAEGSVWLVWRGARANVEKARDIVAGIQGERAFVP
ncbi:MAG TPA: hypothetical protein PKY77_00860 [Phycisphaerae bacterium]|nr:hypothetical protein [Phycisphaerae bacterium]HRY67595.1 hypothetical protein [Phycisphaerae bacterium]HSA24982.1 hypothetical protein [Phycisphaerae bacterium]